MGRTRETKRTRLCPRAGRGEHTTGLKGDLGGGQGTAARRDKRRDGRQMPGAGTARRGRARHTLGPRGRPDPGESKGRGDPPPTARGALGTPSFNREGWTHQRPARSGPCPEGPPGPTENVQVTEWSRGPLPRPKGPEGSRPLPLPFTGKAGRGPETKPNPTPWDPLAPLKRDGGNNPRGEDGNEPGSLILVRQG